jgi:ATP-dependent DNA ligase
MRRFPNGEGIRYQPFNGRKPRLSEGRAERGERLLYCDHLEENGEALFELACTRDLEGIVAKRKGDAYLPGQATWLKIRNRNYSRWIGREELFEREWASDPDWQPWNDCALACQSVEV